MQAVAPEDRRAAFLANEADARLAWDLAVAAVPAASIAQLALPDDRSVKDLVAHRAGGERWSTERMRARREGRAGETIPDGEAYEPRVNQAAYARWRDEPWDEVRAEAAAAYLEFRALVETQSEDELFGSKGSARMIAATGST